MKGICWSSLSSFVCVAIILHCASVTQGHKHPNTPSHVPYHNHRHMPKKPQTTLKSSKLLDDSKRSTTVQTKYTASVQNLFTVKSNPDFEKYQSLFVLNGGGSNDVMKRTFATIGMFAFLAGLIRFFGEKGVIVLVLLAQFAMYKEITTIFKSAFSLNKKQEWHKWIWFVVGQMISSYSVLISRGVAPREILGQRIYSSKLDVVAYFLGSLSLMQVILKLNKDSSTGGTEAIRSYLGYVSSCVMAIVVTMGSSAHIFRTLRDYGMEWVLFSILLVITNDIMAYVFGKLIGQRKLLPTLSPNKTWEGFIGAAVSTMAISIPLLQTLLKYGKTYNLTGDSFYGSVARHALVLACFASIVAPFGGFLASSVKRSYDAKDFGDLIPGHGGIVDRVDCQLVMAPFVYLYLRNYL